jgi:hypothetical protein
MVCGATPAVQVTFRTVAALVVFGVTSTYRGVYCRNCGLALFRKRMNETLFAGWWGFIHFFINVWAITKNLDARSILMRLGPQTGAPAARGLDPGRPVFLRPGFVVTAVVLLVFGTWLAIGASTPPKPFSAEDQAYVGQCVQKSGTDWTPIECVGPHTGQVVSLSHNQYGCPTVDDAVKLPDGNYACVDTTK